MTELVFSREAGADLLDIYAFSVERFGIDAADQYHDGLEEACERLLHFPEMGLLHPAVSPPARYLVFRRHHIFYDISEDTVTVLRILHHAMNVARHLRQ